jgi:uncharacterized protein DUF5625
MLHIIASLALIAFLSWATPVPSADWPKGTLAAYDFDVSRKDTVLDEILTIPEFRSYVVSLRFRYEGDVDLYRVLALVGMGSSARYSGHILPVHILIVRLDNGIPDAKPIIDGVVETKSSFVHAFGPTGSKIGAFGREVTTINLQPESYRIQSNTTRDSPEFGGTPCQLAVESFSNTRFVPNTK